MADENGNGSSIAEMAENGEAKPEETAIIVEGKRGQLTWGVGGLEPATSDLTITGVKLEVTGEYDKGDIIEGTFRARVNEVKFTDEDDPDGFPEACHRAHKAKLLHAEVTEATEAD